jgi:hypothetical protein
VNVPLKSDSPTSPRSQKLAAQEQRREKTRALKQAMMQKLLTVKTRIPVQT